MNIAKINEIFANRGPAAALQTAVAAQMEPWIIRKLEAGEWEPGKKSEPKPAPRYAEMPAMCRPAPRVGKTAKTGGLAAAQRRKREKSLADQKLRASMKGK